jgi:protocatechuate 3,4-dioxygenase beta subunit
MKMTRQFLLVSAATVLLGVCAHAQTPGRSGDTPATGTNSVAQKIKCSGTVTDAAGHPLAGATVAYWGYEGEPFLDGQLKLQNKITTGVSGAFEFQVTRASGFLLAQKPGLAPAWKQLGQPGQQNPEGELKLALTSPAVLAGVAVDEAGKSVAAAEVFVSLAIHEVSQEGGMPTFNSIAGQPARDCFAARTDAAGHFQIENFPTNATAVLAVKYSGKVLSHSPSETAGGDSLPWHGGQTDIKLVMEPAGSIEGKIVMTESNQPLPVARLSLQSDGQNFSAVDDRQLAQSAADGAFHIGDVAAGAYHVQAVFGTNAVSDWIAEAVPVSVEVGKTAGGVQVKATRGALLEVAVLGKNDHKPLPQISVNAYREGFQSAANSDSNGIAHLRLLPGDYQVMAYRESMPGGQVSASVADGQTNRVEIEIAAPQKITGIVHRPDGQPAAGLPVKMVGNFGRNDDDVKTDAAGKFELDWNQRPPTMQNNATLCILVRDAEHNLAVAQDLEEDPGALDLKLAPGLTLVGRAEAGGQPITNATASLVFWSGNSGMWLTGLAQTNTPGRYEIPALPPGRRYGVIVSAPGYGQRQMQNLEISADAGRQELDPVELKPANLKLAGQVLDDNDKPVAGANINLNGDSQPNAHTRTDREGRFSFAHVCEGPLQVSASSQRAYGNVSAEGGDTNVVVRLGQTYNNTPDSMAHKLKGTVTDADGKPVTGAQVAVFPNNGTRWTKTGTNGGFNLTWSLQTWQMQNGGPVLVVRDPVRGLAAAEDLPEEVTNLDVKLKAALTLTGRVQSTNGSPLVGAQISVLFKAGNTYDSLNDQQTSANAEGHFEIKCLPVDGRYIINASANGRGQSQQNIESDADTNRMELSPFVLKLADHVLAGQVQDADDKPVSGVNVNLNGDGQPSGNMATDSKGRFHFKVCEGQVHLYAYSQNGGGYAQATVEAGDTNVTMTLASNSGMARQAPRRASLKGSPLPDLAAVDLAADAAPAGQPVLLCLFDAGQRPSRHVVSQLEQQAAALKQQNISVLGIQAVSTSDEIFNAWKSASPVSFPIGRVTEKSEKTKWASTASALPWLILTDASHRVVAEGFAFADLDAQLKTLTK